MRAIWGRGAISSARSRTSIISKLRKLLAGGSRGRDPNVHAAGASSLVVYAEARAVSPGAQVPCPEWTAPVRIQTRSPRSDGRKGGGTPRPKDLDGTLLAYPVSQDSEIWSYKMVDKALVAASAKPSFPLI